jgi:hypothetical protein
MTLMLSSALRTAALSIGGVALGVAASLAVFAGLFAPTALVTTLYLP